MVGNNLFKARHSSGSAPTPPSGSCRRVGGRPFINFHTHILPEDPGLVNSIISCVSPEPLPECTEGVWVSYGIHPWYIHGHEVNNLVRRVEEAAAIPLVIAVGEAGMDKVRGPDMSIQKELFIRQADISERHGKPMIIHSVRANNEFLALRKSLRPKQPWVLHDFSGSEQEVDQMSEAGFYFSFGPRILYPDGKAARVLAQVDAERFFLETDHSNKAIEPLYAQAAKIRKITIFDVKQQVNANFKAMFPGII